MPPAAIRFGILAMSKKLKTTSMQELISRLLRYSELELVFFDDETILRKPVEEWPVCAALIAYYSDGYPQSAVEEYVRLRSPFLINDVYEQRLLLDRRKIYRRLLESKIPVAHHVFVNRDGFGGEKTDTVLVEHDEYIEVNGVRISKPFVEKPADAEDHDVYIYFHPNTGGGVQKLFRKTDDKSSAYCAELNLVRRCASVGIHCSVTDAFGIRMRMCRDGSYIYEEFLPTQGTDVKVYAVGTDYAHAGKCKGHDRAILSGA
jgi:inositol hexakisphosphate/diphosphoinositol-pentakisphosphate kinase